MHPIPGSARWLVASQPVLRLALAVPALLLTTVAGLPALVILPFIPGGIDRAVRLIQAHMEYARTLLAGSASMRAAGPCGGIDAEISKGGRLRCRKSVSHSSVIGDPQPGVSVQDT